jgi:hypothetical protein
LSGGNRTFGGSRPAALRRAAIGALAATIGLAAFGAQAASAQCGGVQKVKPRHHAVKHGRAPLAIGDSVMLLAIYKLANEGYRVNARGCRQWAEGMDILRQVKRRNKLPHMVTIALGADWTVTPGDIRAALHLLPKNKVLTLVTPRESGGGSSSDATHIREAARKHPHRIVLLDWVQYSAGRSGWFQPDGLHLTFAGAAGFAKLLGRAIPFAKPGKFPNGAHYPHS